MSYTKPLLHLIILISLFSLSSSQNDAVSLLTFKSSLTADPTHLLSTWTPSTPHCTWHGVTCSSTTSRVVSLSLSASLSGRLSPSLANLTDLRVLSLPHNSFSGDIPPEIGSLRHLKTLELQGNNFTGGIPKLPFRFLETVNLSYNLLTGEIPADLFTRNVKIIDLSNNQLSGKIYLQSDDDSDSDGDSECRVLEQLRLSNNFIVGSIPSAIGKCSRLRTLLLDGNILEGSIPREIGEISELRVLDLSRNSLTDEIPKELGKCLKLSVIVLTNLEEYSDDRSLDIFRGEYNAFVGGVPKEVFMIPALQVVWAPRANIGGQLSGVWSEGCSLKVLNLGQNYIDGVVPESLGLCKNLTFVDLSSNSFTGRVLMQFQVSCMVYLNVSRNSLSGFLPSFENGVCGEGMNLKGDDLFFLGEEDVRIAYSSVSVWNGQLNGQDEGMSADGLMISHDFGWNKFTGSLPSVSLSGGLFLPNVNAGYRLLLNSNDINGSLPRKLVSDCSHLHSFAVNLTANRISGDIPPALVQDCGALTSFEVAQNQVWGSIPPSISNLLLLSCLELRDNRLSGSLPKQLGELKSLKVLLLGGNNFTGEVPSQLGRLSSLKVLDLSENNLRGMIPAALGNASHLETLLLDHNVLFGEIPVSFSLLSNLVKLDVSYNNLTGHIPHLEHINDCESFKGNKFLHSCPDPYSVAPAGLPYPLEVRKMHNRRKMKSLIIATATSVSVVLGVLLVIVLGLTLGRKKFGKLPRLRRKVVVTFTDTPIELTYDNVVSATGNFSIRNLIGAGGFGSTYKAEIVPGYLVAVRRLYIGRFQGIQQFEAEIKTLGRVQHKNLVTLIGYYVGDTEMFLIYNYLSGGNLESFIHDRSAGNVKWPAIYKITVDVSHALAYLHYSCVPRIVHRDIKPSNILLDEELNAYLSDFGLARLLEVSETHATTDVAGTFGYVAPEYATTCRVSDKADVYSFGVVLLELLSGKRSFDPSFSEYGNGFNIVGWATMLMEENRSSEVFFSDLWEAGPEENLLKLLRLALSCTVEALAVRPSMKQVLEKLKQLST